MGDKSFILDITQKRISTKEIKDFTEFWRILHFRIMHFVCMNQHLVKRKNSTQSFPFDQIDNSPGSRNSFRTIEPFQTVSFSEPKRFVPKSRMRRRKKDLGYVMNLEVLFLYLLVQNLPHWDYLLMVDQA